MKHLLLFTLLVIGVNGFSQFDTSTEHLRELEIDSTTNKIVFTEVVQTPGVNRSDLYNAAREWFVVSFKSADDVLQMEDKEAGILMGKAFNSVSATTGMGVTIPYMLYYTIKLYFKDGRYKYVVTDLIYRSDDNEHQNAVELFIVDDYLYKNKSKGKFDYMNKQWKRETIKSIDKLISNLKSTMAKAKSLNNDDW